MLNKMDISKGVYKTTRKDNSVYYRVSITYKGKHISLGSFDDKELACKAYNEAKTIINSKISLEDIHSSYSLSLDKCIILLNYRDNNIYFSTPIYLRKNYFEYYLSSDIILKFDRDDLFFYSSHKIQRKGGYIFVSDYGSQYKIQNRYGIKPFAVYGKDYIMANGDQYDYRYSNILIINNYVGVQSTEKNNNTTYKTYIHINGNYLVGTYNDEITAAIAYNKAVDTINLYGAKKQYIKNYIQELSSEQYKNIYKSITISKKLINPDIINSLKNSNTSNQK